MARKRRETESIRAVAAHAFEASPAAGGLEGGTGFRAHSRDQSLPFISLK